MYKYPNIRASVSSKTKTRLLVLSRETFTNLTLNNTNHLYEIFKSKSQKFENNEYLMDVKYLVKILNYPNTNTISTPNNKDIEILEKLVDPHNTGKVYLYIYKKFKVHNNNTKFKFVLMLCFQ